MMNNELIKRDKKSIANIRPVRLAYQLPVSSTFLSEQTSHQPAVLLFSQHQQPATSQQYFSLRTNQPPANSTTFLSAPATRHQPNEQAHNIFV
jgi:hypothetical protein